MQYVEMMLCLFDPLFAGHSPQKNKIKLDIFKWSFLGGHQLLLVFDEAFEAVGPVQQTLAVSLYWNWNDVFIVGPVSLERTNVDSKHLMLMISWGFDLLRGEWCLKCMKCDVPTLQCFSCFLPIKRKKLVDCPGLWIWWNWEAISSGFAWHLDVEFEGSPSHETDKSSAKSGEGNSRFISEKFMLVRYHDLPR